MFHVYRKELVWGGRPLALETGKIARQADGAVLVTYGETTVLCTAVAMKSAKLGQDFFPLTARHRRCRHQRGGPDGRIGGQGAFRGDYARCRDLWTSRVPAGDPGDYRSGRDLCQGTMDFAADAAGNRRHRGAAARQGRGS